MILCGPVARSADGLPLAGVFFELDAGFLAIDN